MKNIRVSEKTYVDLLALIVEMRRRGQNVRIGELTDSAVQEFCIRKMKEIKTLAGRKEEAKRLRLQR